MGDIHYLVDKLNGQPFNLDVTVFSFRLVRSQSHSTLALLSSVPQCLFVASEKTPQELLQLLSDVFAAISPKHQVRSPTEALSRLPLNQELSLTSV